VRRFLGKFSFLAIVLLVVGFAYFTYAISKPVDRAQKDVLVRGTIRPTAALLPDAPFLRYAALYGGTPDAGPLLDDMLAEEDNSFQLRADEGDGTRFYVLTRIETAREELWCETIELPAVRYDDEDEWVAAATREPLPPVAISVGRQTRC
jgi:hypothetical protein